MVFFALALTDLQNTLYYHVHIPIAKQWGQATKKTMDFERESRVQWASTHLFLQCCDSPPLQLLAPPPRFRRCPLMGNGLLFQPGGCLFGTRHSSLRLGYRLAPHLSLGCAPCRLLTRQQLPMV
jgi:hypothetical protein